MRKITGFIYRLDINIRLGLGALIGEAFQGHLQTGNSPRKAYIGGTALPYQCDLREVHTKCVLCGKM